MAKAESENGSKGSKPDRRQCLVSTPLEFRSNPGAIGEFLREIPFDVLEEAERHKSSWRWLAKWVSNNTTQQLYEGPATHFQSEWERYEKQGFKRTGTGVLQATAEARDKLKIQEVRFYFHKQDPSKRVKRVISNISWPVCFRQAFEAAASQVKGLTRLVEVARNGGSISKSWRSQILTARSAGDSQAENHAANKVLISLLTHEPYRTWLLNDQRTPLWVRKESKRRYRGMYKADLRRIGRKKADEKWKGSKPLSFKMKSYSDRIGEALAAGWIAVGENGFPGLCFMSDELLSELLGYTLPLPSLLANRLAGGKLIWSVRKRLGLQQAETLFAGIEQIGANKWAILDLRGNRAHWISLKTDKTSTKVVGRPYGSP